MHIDQLQAEVAIPSGVTVREQHGEFVIKGPKGELTRRLFHPRVQYTIGEDTIIVRTSGATKREKKMVNTLAAHLRNMIRGVTDGYTYTLKICSGHFPMSVTVKGDTLEVKNFIGEAVPRRLKLNPAVKVVVDGTQITVDGNDVDATSQQAARIEQLCRRPGFDKRIFQDGIYITHKGGDAI